MCEHEQKYCPRCNKDFECKVGSILLCQCSAVTLGETELHYIRQQFADCLCADCLKAMKAEYHQQLFREKLEHISTLLFPRP